MKLTHILCLVLTIMLTACTNSKKGGGLMGNDEAWCGYYGEHCEKENDTQCSIWGRCGEDEKEENNTQCSIWGRCDEEEK